MLFLTSSNSRGASFSGSSLYSGLNPRYQLHALCNVVNYKYAADMYFHSVRMYLHIANLSIFALVMFLIGWNLLGGSIGVLPSLSSIFLHCVLKTMMEKNNTPPPHV